jgi:enoyl-CoA hydratase
VSKTGHVQVPVHYEVDGPVATITLDRPDAANAQDTALIDALDAAFARAEGDDNVRVIVLAANGAHFSAGHDLKELLQPEPGSWAATRDTAEGKLRHEWVMYWQRCLRIRDCPKPTVAAVQGRCVAAGLMLACMCDLIVAADDAVFSNPVLRMSGAAVELLVEPWELGIRKAKEFLLTGMEIDANEAWRLGLANRVVARDALLDEARAIAGKIALVPPQTAQIVKDSINNVADEMGQRQSWKYHFMAHQWMSETATAKGMLAARKDKGSMRDVFAEHKDE